MRGNAADERLLVGELVDYKWIMQVAEMLDIFFGEGNNRPGPGDRGATANTCGYRPTEMSGVTRREN